MPDNEVTRICFHEANRGKIVTFSSFFQDFSTQVNQK